MKAFVPNSYSLQRASGSHQFSHHFLLLGMIHPYYESCIYMVLELSTSYVLIIICFSKRPVPSAEKKKDVMGIFAGCRNQNFGRCVTRNKACQINRNGTVLQTNGFFLEGKES